MYCYYVFYRILLIVWYSNRNYINIKSDLNFIASVDRDSTVIRCQVSRSSSWADTAVIL